MKNFIPNLKFYYVTGRIVISILLLVSCKGGDSPNGNVPEIQEKTYKTEIVYSYNITDFASYVLQNFEKNIDAGFFLRDPQLYFKWDRGDANKGLYSANGNGENNFYRTTINLSEDESKELILIEDGNFNMIPKQFEIVLEEAGFTSTAEGYKLKSMTVDFQLFEAIIKVFLKDKEGKLEIMDPSFEDYTFDVQTFNNSGLGMGEKKGKLTHPKFGEIEISYNLSCGNGRGVGCYGDGTFIFPVEGL